MPEVGGLTPLASTITYTNEETEIYIYVSRIPG